MAVTALPERRLADGADRRDKEALIVLGMHRSGTSMTANIATALGATPPATLLPPLAENVKGFWESRLVFDLNNELLASVGSSWSDWRSLSPDWVTTPAVRGRLPEAVRMLTSEFADAPLIVLKDPRICRLYPFWAGVLDAAGYARRHVLVVRSPIEVAQSLSARNGFGIDHGLLLWLRYNLDMEAATRGSPRVVVRWSQLLQNWRREVLRMAAIANVRWPRYTDADGVQIDRIVDPKLRHQMYEDREIALDPRIHSFVLRAYETMTKLSEDAPSNSAYAEMDEVRRAFDDASNLFGPFIAAAADERAAEVAVARAQFAQAAGQQGVLAARAEELKRDLVLARRGADHVGAERDAWLVRASERGHDVEGLRSLLAASAEDRTLQARRAADQWDASAAREADLEAEKAAAARDAASQSGSLAARIADLEAERAAAAEDAASQSGVLAARIVDLEAECETLRRRSEAGEAELAGRARDAEALASALALSDHGREAMAARSRDVEGLLQAASELLVRTEARAAGLVEAARVSEVAVRSAERDLREATSARERDRARVAEVTLHADEVSRALSTSEGRLEAAQGSLAAMQSERDDLAAAAAHGAQALQEREEELSTLRKGVLGRVQRWFGRSRRNRRRGGKMGVETLELSVAKDPRDLLAGEADQEICGPPPVAGPSVSRSTEHDG